jgi:hypothetical protein
MSERKYQRRDERMPDPPGVRITSRDLLALESVYCYRVMTQAQLERLVYVGCDSSVAKARLRKMFQGRYLTRRFLSIGAGKMNTPALYLIDQKGIEELKRRRKYLTNPEMSLIWTKNHKRVSATYLQHMLGIADVRICITRACQQFNLGLLEWRSEPEMKRQYDRVQLGADQVSVIPDSYFAIQSASNTGKSPRHFFLELDRGTEVWKRFRRKVEAYIAYMDSGAYTQRYGTKSLRILTVTESPKRLENLKQVTEAAGGASRFWFACLSELASENILTQPVWQVAGSEAKATLMQP